MTNQNSNGGANESEKIPDLLNNPQDKPGEEVELEDTGSVEPTPVTDMPPNVEPEHGPEPDDVIITPFPDDDDPDGPGGTEDIPVLGEEDKN